MSGLHARARHLSGAVLAVLVLAGASWWLDRWLSARPSADGVLVHLPLVVFGPLVVAVVTSVTLSGTDADLERTAPRLSVRQRAVHGVAAAALACGVLGSALAPHPLDYGAAAAVRNAAGLVGLVLLAATLLPPVVSWAPALVYATFTYLAGPRSAGHGAAWWAWPLQSGRPDASWVVATALLVVGVLAYARRGPVRALPTTRGLA